jgi:protein TonB
MKHNTLLALLVLLVLAVFMLGAVLADTAQAPAAQAKPKPRTVAPKPPPAEATHGHTTIAPFPVPGDTSRAATDRRKTMNVPKQGVTTIVPLPVPPGAMWDPYAMGVTLPQQVDVFPEAMLTVPPIYPDAARDAGIQGTVRVGAHVRTDGTVDSVHIIHSIAGLDSAAIASVKAWRFKPASYQGKPVAVWVGIPVKFTLH